MLSDPPRAAFFFLHIMKTGGATFRQHVYANFRSGEVYPHSKYDSDMHRANMRIDYLLAIPPERRAMTRAYTGHFPFVASEMMGLELVRLTVLREPVARTISYLKHCKRYHDQHRDMTLDEIYEDPFFFPCFIHNHQAKVFSITADDEPESLMDVIDVDDRRLEIAKSNLEKVDVLGLADRHAEFLEELEQRFGWRFDERPDRRVGDEPWDVSRSLRSRIAEDNAADVSFYEHAVRVYERRRHTRDGA